MLEDHPRPDQTDLDISSADEEEVAGRSPCGLPPIDPRRLIEPGASREEVACLREHFEHLHADYADCWSLATIASVRQGIRLLRRQERALKALERRSGSTAKFSLRSKTVVSVERAYGRRDDDAELQALMTELDQLLGGDDVSIDGGLAIVLGYESRPEIKVEIPESYADVCRLIKVLQSYAGPYCHR